MTDEEMILGKDDLISRRELLDAIAQLKVTDVMSVYTHERYMAFAWTKRDIYGLVKDFKGAGDDDG